MPFDFAVLRVETVEIPVLRSEEDAIVAREDVVTEAVDRASPHDGARLQIEREDLLVGSRDEQAARRERRTRRRGARQTPAPQLDAVGRAARDELSIGGRDDQAIASEDRRDGKLSVERLAPDDVAGLQRQRVER